MNKKILGIILLSILFSFTSTMFADGKLPIAIENLRVILPPPVASSTAAYGLIKNTGDSSDTLIKVSTDAGMIMLHKTEIKDGIAEMTHIDKIEIKAGGALILKPMSYHLMLMNINHDIIKRKGKLSLILEFKKAGELEFEIPVLEE